MEEKEMTNKKPRRRTILKVISLIIFLIAVAFLKGRLHDRRLHISAVDKKVLHTAVGARRKGLGNVS